MSLLDIVPAPIRNPFAPGALLPDTVETKNSTYEITYCVRRVGEPQCVVVTCKRGTFAGHSWVVEASEVLLTRHGLHVDGDVNLRTTAPTKVNGEPVSTWS